MKKQRIVNLYAGPGAGKTTLAWALAAELKYLGVSVEYAHEVCKAAAWEGRGNAYWGAQHRLWADQSWSLIQMVGKVDIIVTDSPLLLSLAYAKAEWNWISPAVMADYESYDNFDVFVERVKPYVNAGRIQTEEEAKVMDSKVRGVLDSHTSGDYAIVPGCRGSEKVLVEMLGARGWI